VYEMKNKKYFKIGMAILLSGVLLFAVALTGNAESGAYEQLKMLLRSEPAEASNMTVHMKLSLADNGTTVVNAAGDIKADNDSGKMSGVFNISGQAGEKTFEVFRNGDSTLLHLAGSANWYRTECEEEPTDREFFSKRADRPEGNDNPELREASMDILMGGLKDRIALEEANGLRTFSLTFDKGNMPVLLQAAFGARWTDRPKSSQAVDTSALPAELQAALSEMAQYGDLIDLPGERVLDGLKLSFTVDGNDQPQAAELSADFSGIGADGSSHTYQLVCKMTLADINSTTPDDASADPASIIQIDASQLGCGQNLRDAHQ
jgi:hypothetical protein